MEAGSRGEIEDGMGLAATVAPALSSLSCTKASFTGAGTDSCTVALTAEAPSGGLTIALTSNDSDHIQVPASVTVAGAATTATFTATVAAAYTTHSVILKANYDSVSKTYAIDLVAPGLRSLSCTKATFTGAGTDSCTVTLTAGAPSGGLEVALTSSDGTHIPVPASVTVAAGASTATFTAAVAAAYTTHAVTLTADNSGVSKTYAIDLVAPALRSLSCTKASFAGAGTDSCTVTLTAGAPSGGLEIVLTSSDGTHIPVPAAVTVAAGASTITFTAAVAEVYTTHTVTLTADNSGVSKTYAIDLMAPGLSSLSCTNGTITGAGTASCTVTLTAGAPSGGMYIGLASSDTAHVSVPTGVTIAGGGTTATFTATVQAPALTHTATLTASCAGVTRTYGLDLIAISPGLTLGSTSVAFGDVTTGTPVTQSVQLTSSGSMPLIISSGTVTGTGFSLPGVTFPLTLNPGTSTQIDLQFDPKAAGSSSGTATLTTNTPSGSATIGLTGTGVTGAYVVNLAWDAPTNTSDPVAGYDVFRAVSGSPSYQQLNSGLVGATSYGDTTVQSGITYTYYVVSVDSSGNQSAPSNGFTAAIP